MKIQSEPKAKLKVMKNSAFTIETAPFLPKLHQNMLFIGKRGSGKSVAATNLLRMYKETNTMDRILVISPTFNSNKALMKELDIKEEDVFTDPDDLSLPMRIMEIVDQERDEFVRYQHLVKNFERIMKLIKSGDMRVEDGMIDDYILAYFNIATNTFSLPKPRYECYKRNKPPVISLLVDDCQSTKVFSNRKFFNLVTRHRHLGQFVTGGAVGLTLMICAQNYLSQSGGLNKAVRNNATSLCLFRTKDESELMKVAESFSGEVSIDTFLDMYDVATAEPHSFLFVDLHKKDNHPSMFRKRFDEYLIPDENDDKNI